MRLTLLTGACIISFMALAQHINTDSIQRVLQAYDKTDTVRFRLLIDMSDALLTDEPQESKQYLDEAMSLARRLEYSNGVGETYCSLAIYYWNLTDYVRALEHGLLALRTYEITTDPDGLYETYNTLAGIHTSLAEYEQAWQYMNKMLDLGKSNKVTIDYGILYFNMAWLSLKQHKNEQGLDLINKSLAIMKERNDPYHIGQIYFLRAKAFQALGKTESALEDFQYCIQINRSVDHPNGLSSLAAAHEGIADIYLSVRNMSKAGLHLDTALRMATQMQSANLALKIYGHQASLFETAKNFEKALYYERLRGALRDSILNSEKARQLAEVQTKYETEKKEQTIQILERDKEIDGLWRNLLMAGLSIVLVTSGAVIFWLRDREMKNKKLFDLQIDYLTAKNRELSLKYTDPANAANGSSVESQDQRFLKRALDVVENHIADPLFGVEKMAEELAMTRANLHRKLKTLTGTAPSDFIRNIRLKRAATLLLNQADTISRIGFAVGFEDQSYFAKAFRKHYGVAPSEYAPGVETSV